MPLDDVRIQLEAFEGPLDLLLHLIRRDEVDIADIPIARLTEQYLATLSQATGDGGGIENIDVETAGEFLVMAATLMEIKSRMLMPAPPAIADGEPLPADGPDGQPGTHPGEDPRADLVRQLLAYKKYRDAATTLDRRLGEWESRFPGGGATVPDLPVSEEDEAAVEIEDVDVVDLARAFASIMETVDLTKVGDHHVTDDETPIELHAADILERLRSIAGALAEGGGQSRPEIEFRQIFAGRTRAEAIGLFLALLELVRQRHVEAVQDRINERIVIRLRDQQQDGTAEP